MARDRSTYRNPWTALWAMMFGFFMIPVDATAVVVANPTIMAELNTGYDMVMWVTSSYLLAYAVPLLVAGRLGDRFGPKNLYLIGLAVFTAASLWCGLSNSIGMLIAARVLQGIGAALLTPQALSMITRTCPAEHRGAAQSVWGAVAAVATLVGPMIGGVLVDNLGWQSIFLINVPIGIVGLALAVRLVPALPTRPHRFGFVGAVLSGVGVFCVVFALQQGPASSWAPWIWVTIAAGAGFVAAFFYWQSVDTRDPLIPLEIFRDRNFTLASVGVLVASFVTTAMVVPTMFYAQAVCGLSPLRSALVIAPIPIVGGLLAPVVGRIVDRSQPRRVIGCGFSVLASALIWLAFDMAPTTPMWRIVAAFTAMGVGLAFIWIPLAATSARNLPTRQAGAGSGIYSAAQQLGAVLGSAGLAAFMTSRVSREMPTIPDSAQHTGSPHGPDVIAQLPDSLRESFSVAMSQSMMLPAIVAVCGVVAALFMVNHATSAAAANR